MRVDRSDRFTQIYILHISTPELPYGQLLVATHTRSLPPDNDDLEHDMVVERFHAPGVSSPADT